jgi:predicted nucleotidyltransferase
VGRSGAGDAVTRWLPVGAPRRERPLESGGRRSFLSLDSKWLYSVPWMMSDPISESEAWEVLDDLVRLAQIELGDRLVCLTAFGSLVNGDYVPGFSDIDQVIVARAGAERRRTAEVATAIVRSINQRPGKFRECLHEGYVVSQDAIWSLDADSDEGLVLRDVLDLALHGRTMAGDHIWPMVRSPTEEELRESVVYGVFWIPERLPSLKSILNCIFAVAGARFYCTTGTMTWTKRDLVRRYVSQPDLPFGALLAEAATLRNMGSLPPDDAAAALKRLQPPYLEFLHQTRAWMTSSGLTRLHSIRTKVPGVTSKASEPPPPFGWARPQDPDGRG